MVNHETAGVVSKLRSCRLVFKAAAVVGVLLAALTYFPISAALNESVQKIAVIFLVVALLFVWGTYISIRENRILSNLILEMDRIDDVLVVTTIFSKKISIKAATATSLDPKWMRKRRGWPLSFLKGNDAIQYARHASKVVKAVSVNGEDCCFYWVCTVPAPALKYVNDPIP